MKTLLKHILQIKPNEDSTLGKFTRYMVWSSIHHSWIYPNDWSYDNLTKAEKKFLLKQEVVTISLRNDSLNFIAIFLKDYGKEKNKKLRNKICKR